MAKRPDMITLTAELVALVDGGQPAVSQEPSFDRLSDGEYARLAKDVHQQVEARPLLVFAYGSLIWNPAINYDRGQRARAYGWRRSFCLNLTHWRATPAQPGLMLALDYGGCCDGIVFECASINEATIEQLLRRELDCAQDVLSMRWIRVRCGNDTQKALTFYAAPRGASFIDLPISEQARRLAAAVGRAGSCASYLHHTVVKLQEYGIHDRYLWRLQKLVADELRRKAG